MIPSCLNCLSPYQEVKDNDEEDKEYPNDLFHNHNIAIPMAYFSVGFVSSFMTVPLNIYMVKVLDAEPAMQNTIGILQTLPWSLKLLFGFLSDACPIGGLHRKPYLALGSLLYSTAFISYSVVGWDNVVFLAFCIFLGTFGLIQMDVMADTMCVERSKFEPEDVKGQMQATCYSVRFSGSVSGAILGALLCNQKAWGWGLSYMQVSLVNGLVPFLLVTPFLCNLRERYQKIKHRLPVSSTSSPVVGSQFDSAPASPQLQYRSANYQDTDVILPLGHGNVPVHLRSSQPVDDVAADVELVRGGSFDSKQSSTVIDAIDAKLAFQNRKKLKKYLSFWTIEEEKIDSTVDVRKQLHEIWETVQLQAVWRPMAFVYLYNLFQIPNVAWQSFLQLSLNFPNWVLGMSVILGSIMTLAGVLAYKYWYFKSSWRSIYVSTTALIAFFSMLQLVLIFQINVKYLHLSNYFFSLGDDTISAYISGVQFLPVCIMYMKLCPDGAEGASYSMLTTFGNVALTCACSIGNYLATVWDVSNAAMERHDVSGLWKLATFTSLLSMLPLCLLFLLPKDAEDQDELSKSPSRSKIGGAIFLLVLFGSLTWTVTTAVGELLQQ